MEEETSILFVTGLNTVNNKHYVIASISYKLMEMIVGSGGSLFLEPKNAVAIGVNLIQAAQQCEVDEAIMAISTIPYESRVELMQFIKDYQERKSPVGDGEDDGE